MIKQDIEGMGRLYAGTPTEVLVDVAAEIRKVLVENRIGMNGLTVVGMLLVAGSAIGELNPGDGQLDIEVCKDFLAALSTDDITQLAEVSERFHNMMEKVVKDMGGKVVEPGEMPTIAEDSGRKH